MTGNKNQLKEIGTVSHITSTNKIIIPTTRTPPIGIILVNKNNKPIGKINDLFGSTKKPYISIKTNKHYHKIVEGQKVYIKPTNRKRRKKHGRNSKKKKTFR